VHELGGDIGGGTMSTSPGQWLPRRRHEQSSSLHPGLDVFQLPPQQRSYSSRETGSSSSSARPGDSSSSAPIISERNQRRFLSSQNDEFSGEQSRITYDSDSSPLDCLLAGREMMGNRTIERDVVQGQDNDAESTAAESDGGSTAPSLTVTPLDCGFQPINNTSSTYNTSTYRSQSHSVDMTDVPPSLGTDISSKTNPEAPPSRQNNLPKSCTQSPESSSVQNSQSYGQNSDWDWDFQSAPVKEAQIEYPAESTSEQGKLHKLRCSVDDTVSQLDS